MSAALLQSIPIALGLVFAAAPMVLLALILVTKRAPRVSYAMVAGWLVGLLVVGAIAIAVTDVVDRSGEPARWTIFVKLGVGIGLGALAVWKWMRRARPTGDPSTPGWMAAAETMTARRALGLGVVLAAANPKNLALVVAGSTVIAETAERIVDQALALIVFALVASVGVAAPSIIRLVLGARSQQVLEFADRVMTRHSAAIVCAVLLVLGVVLIGNAIAAL